MKKQTFNHIADLEICILNVKEIPSELRSHFFKIEYETFSDIYSMCPRNLIEFDKRYEGKDLVIVVARLETNIIGYRIFEVVNKNIIQSMFMVVVDKWRKKGLANLICSLSVSYLRYLNYCYVVSWTHINLDVVKILAKHAQLISESSKLQKEELDVLRIIEQYWDRKLINESHNRIIKDFYSMLDNEEIGDANFWVHRL